jgi:hypothetical protein
MEPKVLAHHRPKVATFIHTVDARFPADPLSVKDEGLFNKLANGDDLETGSMMNPDTGAVMRYEEIWREIPVEENAVALLESVGQKDKTYVGRIGKWFEGIGTRNGKINAIRKELKDGEWRTVFVVGDEAHIPVFEETGWKVGDQIELNGRSWKVLDCQI